MAYTLGGYGLGRVKSISITKTEKADSMSIPYTDSNELLVFSYEGARRQINISGLYTPQDGNVSTFINNIEGLINGQQTLGSGISLVTGADDYPASTTFVVHIEEFRWTWDVGNADSITYSLKLIERG